MSMRTLGKLILLCDYMDLMKKIRLTNRDLYGRAVFFDDSFLVKRKTGNQFTIQPGNAYVEGVSYGFRHRASSYC
ncbi:hypothetical protein MZA92_00025 [Haemophilus influenzae]